MPKMSMTMEEGEFGNWLVETVTGQSAGEMDWTGVALVAIVITIIILIGAIILG